MIPTSLPSAYVERELERALGDATGDACPPGLADAMRHAVFPGGARIRPRLCLAVAAACGAHDLDCAASVGAAIELLHCASLVHDDLPCFDDADLRRGKPSVHRAYGEALAVLTGDALIIAAYRALAAIPDRSVLDLPALVAIVSDAVGARGGLCAGQAWECEDRIDLGAYHRAKTGALFASATEAGAVAAGSRAAGWRDVGLRLGEAFQVADDLRDVAGAEEELGKPVGQDAAHGRPSAAETLGIEGAKARLTELVEHTVDAIPPCPGQTWLSELIRHESRAFLPKRLALAAA